MERRGTRDSLLVSQLDLSRANRSQVTIFIILAIVIVTGVVVYFLVFSGYQKGLSKEMQPVHDYYLSCLEEHARQGISLLGEQGGYIYVNELDFVPGSQYLPFSSQLDFLGQPIPYWMYVSGNGILKEQVPTKAGMEKELERYIQERAEDCDFLDFNLQGYEVLLGEDSAEAEVDVSINNLDVSVSVDKEMNLFFEEQSAFVKNHDFKLNSKLGKFYDLSLDTYNHEKQNMFLEAYSLDVMRLYAPVTGVEISCTPKIFIEEDIRQDLASGLEANIGMLKLKGDYYTLNSQESNYFVEDIGRNVDENVNFIYSQNWPTNIEIYGDKIVEPVGMQQGLGILGFCYVDYHLIYDINIPVLIQFWDNEELFQFPVAMIVQKNQPREALPSLEGVNIESEVCKYENQETEIYSYDTYLNPVEARISFKCLNSICEIGETKLEGDNAVLRAGLPQCVNGFVIARAEGYADGKYMMSTNKEALANVILNKKYMINLDLGNVDKALIRFESGDYKQAVLYPDMKEVELTEGSYNVSVYVYSNSSLTIPAVNKRECVEVADGSLLGLFGKTSEKCFDINIPETKVDMAVVGGGKTEDYFIESVLQEFSELNINVPLFGKPSTLEGLQENYQKVEDERIYLEFE